MPFFKFKSKKLSTKIINNLPKKAGFLANYWIWTGMIDSYKILKKKYKTSTKNKRNKKRLFNLQKQILLHFLKNFFLFPLWFFSLLIPVYLKGSNNVWTNLATIGKLIKSHEFRPLRMAVISQFVFVFLIVQFGIMVFYNNSNPVYTASYGWVSTDWSGSASTTAFASHNTDQNGWNKYFSKDNTINTTINGEITLGDINLSTYTQTTDNNFNSGSLNNLYVANNSFSLLKDNGVSCTSNNECSSGICNTYTNLCSDDANNPPPLITTTTFNYTGTIQNYTVPAGVTSLTINAKGAQGGYSSNGVVLGGLGANITGTVTVTPGQILKILVGGQGVGSSQQGGGGGGSFTTDNNNNPLIIAGGGGGGYYNGYPYGAINSKGSISSSGNAGIYGYGGATGGAGGTNGNGGGCSPQYATSEGSGGGGLIGNGTNCYGTTGGKSFINGGAGGAGAGAGGAGGFGGGGGGDWSSWTGGGGGGGYSGGGGGTYYGTGGGGGSYNAGINPTNLSGTQSGNGQIIIVSDSSGSSGSSSSGGETTTETFNYTGTIQTFTVPAGVTSIDIDAYGAQGGTGLSYTGGLGAKMKGTFTVTPGQILKVLVGQQGGNSANYKAGGGGGGSFITDNSNSPLVVAGGGGGGGGNSSPSNGNPGLTTTSGGNSSSSSGGSGGSGGGASSGSDGGGGLTGNGTNTSSCTSGPGLSFINGGAGGIGGTCTAGGGYGGFGGGSGGEWCCQGAPGAGGGYSGGAGCNSTGVTGGGGSYNAGTNQTNISGARSGNGQVLISYVSNFPPTITSIVTGTSTIQLNWNAVSGASSYTVSSTVGSEVTTTSTSYTFDVTPNTSYAFQIATNLSSFSSVTSTKINLGTYTSPINDAGASTLFNNISWNATNPSPGILIVEARAGNEADLSDGVWTTFQSGDELITNFDGKRYFQYRATIATNNASALPSMEDVTITYTINSGYLISSPYDTGDDTSMLARISWSEDTPGNSLVRFQVRTSPDANTWTDWMGPDATSASYFTDSTGGQAMPEVLRNASDDRWIQYLVYLEGDIGDTPTLSNVTLAYAVNIAPVISNVTAVENTDGSVTISYDVLDNNTSSGQTPGTILPTFEYLDGNGDWITATTFSENATSSKAVEEFTTSTYSLIWYPKTDFNGQYLTDCQIRVTANDSEAANNLGNAMSEPFVLDTASPTISLFLFDGRNDNLNNITITASDDTLDNLLIKISNLNNLNPDGTNASSGIWLAYTPNFTWRMDNSSPNIYYQLKDHYGNTTSVTPAQLPGVPNHAVYRDISNAETSEWREFVAWATVANPAYGFKQYNIYRSDDGGTSFTVIDTIANRSINYYIDSDPALSPETTYTYKITAEDNNNNESDYSNLVTDSPNGQGGSDFTAPTISNVNISYITPNGATITWDTDEPADSNVDYILSTGGNFDNAPSVGLTTMTDNVNSLGQHVVVLTGLNSGTTYYLRIGSADSAGNDGHKVPDIDGYTFQTIAGPTISNIIVSNISNSKATITWETDEASDSYVYVADNSNFSAPVTYGNTNATNNHSVTVDNLVLNTRYYFYVASGVSYDKNVINGEITYYDFNTTADTSLPIITFSNENGISNLGDTSARISWTTDKSTTSTLDYGLNTNYGNTLSNDNYNTNHSYDLSNLTLGTTYYVRIQNTDLNSNNSTSTLFSFTTTDSTDLVAPTISNVTTSVITDHAAIIVWSTNEGASSQVFYGTNSSTLDLASSVNTTSNLTHTVVISELGTSTVYYYYVKSVDSNENTTTSTLKNFTTLEKLSTESEVRLREAIANQAGRDSLPPRPPSGGSSNYIDSTPPTINSIKVINIGSKEATITWLSNEESDSIAKYGITKNEYLESVTDVSRKLEKTHQISLTELIPQTTYHYQITSADSSHNVSKASTGTFTTLSPTDDFINNAVSSSIDLTDLEGADAENMFLTSLRNAADLIKNMSSKVGLGVLDSALSAQNTLMAELSRLLPTPVVSGQPLVSVTSNSATIAWNTDKESNSLVSFSDENTYASSALYDQTIGEADKFVLNHLVEIKNLVPDTFYHYSVISRTNTGAETRSQDFNFKTSIETNDIQNYNVNILTPAEAIFSWQTNLPTESSVSFIPYRNGVLDIEAKQTVSDKSLTINHDIKINSFEAGVVYDIELSGLDLNGNILSKAIKGFSSEKENLPPIISQIQTDSAIIPGEKERIQVIISWITNELSTSRVLYQKGFNKDNNNVLSDSTEIDSNYNKKHVVVINDFDPGAVYQFQVESIDSSGNSTISKTINMLTPQKEESVFQVIFGSFQNMFSWVGKMRS